MPKDGILWTTGILAGDLRRACLFHTGHVWAPVITNTWKQLAMKILASPYSVWEYFFWLVHYSRGPNRFDVLQMTNTVCGEDSWYKFLVWKEDANRFARVQMELHVDEAKTSSRIRPLVDVLLDPDLEIGPVARVELALHTDDYQQVLLAYAQEAGDVLRGMPEFIEHSPMLKKYLENPDAARQFLPC